MINLFTGIRQIGAKSSMSKAIVQTKSVSELNLSANNQIKKRQVSQVMGNDGHHNTQKTSSNHHHIDTIGSGVVGASAGGSVAATIQQSNIRGLQMNIKSEKQVKNMDKLLSLMKNNVTVLKKGKHQITVVNDKSQGPSLMNLQPASEPVPTVFRLRDSSIAPSP